MKLLLLDDKKVIHHNLPETVSGEYLFHYVNDKSKVIHTLQVVSKDDNWYIKSNDSINIIQNGTVVPDVKLDEYQFYNLSTCENSGFLWLYSSPTIDKFRDNYALNKSEILVGRDSECDICFKSQSISNQFFKMYKQEDNWYITVLDAMGIVYLNDNRIFQSKIGAGDVIYTYGLKIVFMGAFIQINSPSNWIQVNNASLSLLAEEKALEYKNEIINIENIPSIYNEEDYFSHIPRLKEKIETVKMTIDSPPESTTIESMPFILTLGSSLTMMSSSFIMIYSVITGLSDGSKTLASAIPNIVMCVALVIGSLVMPRVTTAYQKRKSLNREKERQVKYSRYLEKKEQEIKNIGLKQASILKSMYIGPTECRDIIDSKNLRLWDREIQDDDFLTIRLGIGEKKIDIEVEAPSEHFTLDEDNLKEMAAGLIEKTNLMNDVPITYSLLTYRVSAIINSNTFTENYINYIILQLVTYHSPRDLKLVFLLSEGNQQKWSYAKFLPHAFSDDREVRFFATNIDELKSISSFLSDELKERKETAKDSDSASDATKESYKNNLPYYLIITDDFMFSRNANIVEEILESKTNYGFSILMFENSLRRLPSECNCFIQVFDQYGVLIEKEVNNQSRFVADKEYSIDMNAISSKLLNIPVLTKDSIYELPRSLTFLEMFEVSKIPQLNIFNRWKSNDPTVSLQAQIGVHKNGDPFYLDLHEKYHGPHGLIAGSTGSGKSEFIISFILSMALNYHPDDVQFVLIDYKGGGLTGAFENRKTNTRIPHLAGTITNLDTSEMHRSLVSINSELKRREHMFNEAKNVTGESTIDIYKYQKYYKEGIIKEPISHLFIISDEFAELKAQQPEFMDELISTSRIGRSLGVHLILATQKPSGVVNDQIWSNSRFKICLKVQSKSDSMEMLKKPDAASIKEAGRFYLQVGYDEYYDIGQSGYSGAAYIPSEKIVKKYDDSVTFINNVGNTVKTVNNFVKFEAPVNIGDQLTNVVKDLIEIAKRENISIKKLWLDPIPAIIYLDEIKEKYNFQKTNLITPVIGEYDSPVEQKQNMLLLNMNDGSTLIYGKIGSGKEDLLATIVYSSSITYSPEEVCFYIIDLGSEFLKTFAKFPHVGEVCVLDDEQKIIDMLIMVDDEIDRRKDLLAEYAGSYAEYCKSSGQKLPIMNVIINNYDVFAENFKKLANDSMAIFFRESSKVGINFIVTTSTTNSIRQKTAEYFSNKICMQMANDYDYTTYLQAPKGLTPAKHKGRGVVNLNGTCYEFQTATPSKSENINSFYKEVATKLSSEYKIKVPAVPTLPNQVTINDLSDSVLKLNELPIGYNIYEKRPFGYDFVKNKITQIISNNIQVNYSFIKPLTEELKIFNTLNIFVIDTNRVFPSVTSKMTIVQENYNNFVKSINTHVQTANSYYLYIFIGIEKFVNCLDEESLKLFEMLMQKFNSYSNIWAIISDTSEGINKIRLKPWYISNVKNNSGIWLGDDVDKQNIIYINNLSKEDKNTGITDVGFAIDDGKYTLIRHVVEGDENER